MRSSQCSSESPSSRQSPVVAGSPAPPEARPSTGNVPVPQAGQRQPGVSEITSAFARLQASPAAAARSRGSSGRTSLLSQQLRSSATQSPSTSSADSSPASQSALRGGPLHKRFTMRSALSAELAGLPNGRRSLAPQSPQDTANPQHVAPLAAGHLVDAGRTCSNPLPLLPAGPEKVAQHALGAGSAPFAVSRPSRNSSPARWRAKDGRCSTQSAAVCSCEQAGLPPRHRTHDQFGAACSPCSMASSAASPPMRLRAREPVMVPGARASLPGRGLFRDAGSNIRVSFDSEDDENGSLGDLSI